MNDRQKILSCLIGLARAAEGNEGKLDGETDRLVCTALSAIGEEKISSDAVDYILSALRKEKKRIAPDCFSCASPCGRTDDPDLSALSDSPEVSERAGESSVRHITDREIENPAEGDNIPDNLDTVKRRENHGADHTQRQVCDACSGE